MAGRTISTYVYSTVTVGVGGYVSPLTIASSGAIDPTDQAYGATGIYLGANQTIASIVNHGRVYGASGNYSTSVQGGVAVMLKSTALLSNSGNIIGGYGYFGEADGGDGGNGIDDLAFASITNVSTGLILGGDGGVAANKSSSHGVFYGNAGVGGVGVNIETGATLSNAGNIRGGYGGSAYYRTASNNPTGGNGVDAASDVVLTNSGYIRGGSGGAIGMRTVYGSGSQGGQGVSMEGLSRLTNSGIIAGGAGGYSAVDVQGGDGNEGVFLNEATAANTGLIIGGAGSNATYNGGDGGLGVAVYNYASLSNSKGTIIGGAGGEGSQNIGDATGSYNSYTGGGGAFAVIVSSYGTVANGGRIIGGAGGYARGLASDAGAGGGGIYLDSGRVTNSGSITGGRGGSEYGSGTTAAQTAGAGGTGLGAGPGYIYTRGNTSIVNYGLIRGGAGGYVFGAGGTAGAGGAGVLITDASLSNHGTIIGGVGGYAGQNPGNYGYGGIGGNGVVVGLAATLTNIGKIAGGVGGANVFDGVAGGDGVYITGGIFTDTGTVAGGYGGVTQGRGAQGDAVLFGGNVAGTLVAGVGAKFIGGIAGNYGIANVIELTGSSSTAFAGVGSSINGIADFSFATGAQRSLEGSAYGLNFVNITNFAAHDTIIVDGFTALLKNTAADPGPYFQLSNATGGFDISFARATAKEFMVTDSGGKTTIALAVSTAHTLSSNAAQFVDNGGVVTGTTINTGGFDEIYNGGTSTNTTIAGGELLLKIGAKVTGNIAFTSVKGGDLQINSMVLPTSTISGFIAGDTIDLAGLVYNSQDSVTVAKAGIVSIIAPGITYALHLAGATVGEKDFVLSAANGVTLSKSTTAAPKSMQFVAAQHVAAAQAVAAQGAATMSGAAAALPAPAVVGKSHGFAAAVVERPVAGAVGLNDHARPAMFWLDSKHLIG